MEIKEIKILKSKFKVYIKMLLDLENLFNIYNQKSVKDSGYLIYKKYFIISLINYIIQFLNQYLIMIMNLIQNLMNYIDIIMK